MNDSVTHTGKVWLWSAEGKGSWHFLTLDGEAGEAIAAHEAMRRLELRPILLKNSACAGAKLLIQ